MMGGTHWRLVLILSHALTHSHTITFCITCLQDQKRSIVAAALEEGGDATAAAKKLTMDDLFFLFGRDE